MESLVLAIFFILFGLIDTPFWGGPLSFGGWGMLVLPLVVSRSFGLDMLK